jgi:hypothetical protein
MDDLMASGGLRMSCRPGRDGGKLIFAYTLDNDGPTDLLVMDATASVDPATRQTRANDQAAVVMFGPDDDAIVGKFAALVPTVRQVAMPVLPLAVRLPRGGTLERRLEVPLPLAETSPYFTDLLLRQYEMVEIRAVSFTIGYWHANAAGLASAPVPYAPGLLVVVAPESVRGSVCTQRFSTKGLQLFKRSDGFPRTLT